MSAAPPAPRAAVFVDGQNLFHSVRAAFGYSSPNFDVTALGNAVCRPRGWNLKSVQFYTGVPDERDHPGWSRFWAHKLAAMGRHGVEVVARPLRYRDRAIILPDGSPVIVRTGEEKGIDVRIALDVIGGAHRAAFDVAVIFSQDQDLAEVADELRAVAREQKRWIKVASAFPASPSARSGRGINKTDWIPIDRATYDRCLDRRDYRGGTKL